MQDHGPGIAKADQRLFAKFYQVKQRSSARSKRSGHGAILSIESVAGAALAAAAWC